jgi:thiol-disulfide isomerase/thioredoxin
MNRRGFFLGLAAALAAPAGARAAEVGGRVAWTDVPLIDGTTIAAARLVRAPVVVEFWASWCPFCARQNPHLEALWRDVNGRGLELLTVSIDRDPAKARAYVAEHRYTFPVTMADAPIAREFEPRKGLPELYVVDASGRIVVRESGEMFPEDVRALARYARA